MCEGGIKTNEFYCAGNSPPGFEIPGSASDVPGTVGSFNSVGIDICLAKAQNINQLKNFGSKPGILKLKANNHFSNIQL